MVLPVRTYLKIWVYILNKNKNRLNIKVRKMSKNKRIIAWLIAFLPLVITIIVFPMLPDKIPAHYGFDGEITRYGSKYEVFIVPIFTIFFGFFWLLIEKIYPKEEKYEQSKTVLFWGNISVSLIFTVVTVWFLYLGVTQTENIYSTDIDFIKIMPVCLNIFWIILGLILPKFKQNGISGIRTPWTLKSENCWEETHKFGGKVFVIYGIIFTLLSLFVFNGLFGLYFSLCGLFVVLIIVVIYSYQVYKKEKNSIT